MPSTARRLARRYLPHRLRKLGLDLIGQAPAPPPVPRRARPKRKKAKRTPKVQPPAVRAKATHDPVIEVLRKGGSLADAVVADVRGLVARGDRDLAMTVAASLRSDPSAAELGDLTTGIVAATGGHLALAWYHLRDLPEPLWARHAAKEWVFAGFDQEPEHVRKQLARLADEAPDFVPASAWLAMFGPVFAHGYGDLATQLFTVFDARVGDGSAVESSLVVHRDWLRPWVAAPSDGPTAPAVPDGSTSFAIMDYGHPGRARASANIGDHVQSLASLGHLVRHQDLRYDGRQDLVDLLTQLRSRVRPELQRRTGERRVSLIQIDRDASMYAAIPPNTWALAFGWYMHAIFETRYGFPFHPNLLPIFVSFHCSKRDLLTDEAMTYLRRFAPIGCRDWTTVDILLSVDVPAFFSGCLTSTIRTVFPERVDQPADRRPRGIRRHARRGGPPRCARSRAQLGCDPVSGVRDQRKQCGGPAGDLPRLLSRDRDESPALLPAASFARRSGRLPAQEPVRPTVRGLDRHHR